jgi:NAD(P)H-hydrate repair Nnr-like enzyme with NAD(P)H-hydrate dehydratase domain
MTPNSAEACRLLERDLDDPATDVPAIAKRYQAVVSCQGWIADPDGGCWQITTGHVGLGTSGSGDVLAGALAGLRARGATASQAACWGTYLHAAAGDRLTARVGKLGFLARELLDEMPGVMAELVN